MALVVDDLALSREHGAGALVVEEVREPAD
jgi:hypothetical protein